MGEQMLARTLRWTVATAMVAFLMLPAAASAAEDLIVIPVSGFARGEEGDLVTIATVDVPAETVGATCQITGRTVNQVSVHDGNDLLIITNGQTFVVPDFEDAGFIEHEAGEVASVGSTIELQIRFGPDGLSSGGFRVTVECDPENFTTTTVPAPPSTEAPPEPPTTAGEEPPSGPTTEAPSTTAVPTTAVPTTGLPSTALPSTSVDANPPTTAEEPPAGPTTEAPATTSTTVTPTTVTPTTETPPAGPQADDDAALPVTGSSTDLILGFGAVFIAAGVILRRFASAAV